MVAPFFTPAEVAEFYDLQLSGLTDTCAVRAIDATPNGAQGFKRAWPTVTQTVACAQLSQAAAIAAGVFPDETSGANQNVIQIMRDVVVNAGDRIEVNGDGVTWSVEGDPKRPGTMDQSYYLQCSRVPL